MIRGEFQQDCVIHGVNPYSTGFEGSDERRQAVAGFFLDSAQADNIRIIRRLPTPADFASTDGRKTANNPDGGDGTARLALQAEAGIVEDDMDATADNLAFHRLLVPNILIFASAGGNANNFQNSAHGKLAYKPSKLWRAELTRAYHRPLMWQLHDERGTSIKSGAVVTGLGLGAAKYAAEDLTNAKSRLKGRSQVPRLVSETDITFRAIFNAPAFSALTTKYEDGRRTERHLQNITGFELIGSKVYAKQGKAPVNVDTTTWQPIVINSRGNTATRALSVASAGARLQTGRHYYRPIDLAGTELRITPTDGSEIPFHLDGDVQDDLVLRPGQTLRLKLAQLAMPVIMAA